MTFDPTISAGNLITLVGMVFAIWLAAWRTYIGLIRRTDQIESALQAYDAAALASGQRQEWIMHRLEKHDDLLTSLGGDVRQILGRLGQHSERSSHD